MSVETAAMIWAGRTGCDARHEERTDCGDGATTPHPDDAMASA
jgi:hypothetical protein